MNGTYIGNLITTYIKDDVVAFKCNFNPDVHLVHWYIKSIKCGENGWNEEPYCPGIGYKIEPIFYAVNFCKQ